MADFVEKTVNKSALRELAFPIPDVETFDEIVCSVIDENPFGCVGYTTKAGQTIAPVIRNREHYTAKVNFIDDDGKKVGTVSIQSPSIAAFNANVAEALVNAAFAARCSDRNDCPSDRSLSTVWCEERSGRRPPAFDLQWVGMPSATTSARPTTPSSSATTCPSGDDYHITFTRTSVWISSYQDDMIRDAVEARADAVPGLN